MKRPFLQMALAILLLLHASCSSTEKAAAVNLLAAGRQPQLAVDHKGVTRVVYGLDENIYCATSTDQGNTFSRPVLVGQLKGLYLGMSMGPQIASSANYSVITAIDKQGNIHSYSLQHDADKWVKAAGVNDIPGSVPEGLMSIAADKKDTFYAVWLDVRNTKHNKLVFATTGGDARVWTKNKVVYESPDSTVCECCKPGIAVEGKQVVLMFRNWLDGARDFYITRSTDSGQEFSQPEKLGNGTWKLEGCPMDGGGLVLDEKNALHTTWQREGNIYYAQPGSPEIQVGKGRHCRISGTTHPVISWKEDSILKLKFLNTENEVTVGNGSYIETAEMPDKSTLCVWENEKEIYFKKI